MAYQGDKLWQLMSRNGRAWIDADAVTAVYTNEANGESCHVSVSGCEKPFFLNAPMSDFMTWLLAEKATEGRGGTA